MSVSLRLFCTTKLESYKFYSCFKLGLWQLIFAPLGKILAAPICFTLLLWKSLQDRNRTKYWQLKVLQVFQHCNEAFQQSRKVFQQSHKVFTRTIGGKQMFVISLEYHRPFSGSMVTTETSRVPPYWKDLSQPLLANKRPSSGYTMITICELTCRCCLILTTCVLACLLVYCTADGQVIEFVSHISNCCMTLNKKCHLFMATSISTICLIF